MVILLPIDSYASKGYEANADADGVALQSVCPATCKQDCSSGSTSRLQDVELSIIILLESFSSKRMHSNIFSSPSSLRINGCTPMIVFFQPQHFAPASPRSTASHIGRNTNDLFGFPFLVHPNSCKYISRIDVANPISEVTHC
jgi:hypothetical protein